MPTVPNLVGLPLGRAQEECIANEFTIYIADPDRRDLTEADYVKWVKTQNPAALSTSSEIPIDVTIDTGPAGGWTGIRHTWP